MGDAGACLAVARVGLAVDLHPSRAGAVQRGVREELAGVILKYSEELGGVVLAYSGLRILGSKNRARILDGIYPFFHLKLAAKLLLFRPTVGSMLDGVVSITGANFVGVLVNGVFNASIRGQQILQRFITPDDEIEQDRPVYYGRDDNTHKICVGMALRFAVSCLRRGQDDSLVLDGDLTHPRTGSLEWLERSRRAEAAAPVHRRLKHGAEESERAGRAAVRSEPPALTPAMGRTKKKKAREVGSKQMHTGEGDAGTQRKLRAANMDEMGPAMQDPTVSRRANGAALLGAANELEQLRISAKGMARAVNPRAIQYDEQETSANAPLKGHRKEEEGQSQKRKICSKYSTSHSGLAGPIPNSSKLLQTPPNKKPKLKA